MSRRNFLGRFVIGVAAAVAGFLVVLVGGSLATPWLRRRPHPWARAGALGDFTTGFRRVDVAFPTATSWTEGRAKRLLYVRLLPGGGDQVLALAARCTHLGCNVSWQESAQRFECPCHGGVYDVDGLVVAGPPPRPLQRFETRIENGQLLVREA